jgi:hypothetical protein
VAFGNRGNRFASQITLGDVQHHSLLGRIDFPRRSIPESAKRPLAARGSIQSLCSVDASLDRLFGLILCDVLADQDMQIEAEKVVVVEQIESSRPHIKVANSAIDQRFETRATESIVPAPPILIVDQHSIEGTRLLLSIIQQSLNFGMF